MCLLIRASSTGLVTLQLLGSVGISLHLCGISPRILFSMDASGELNFLLVDSVLLKCVSQERKPGRSHIAFYDVAWTIMQHRSGQAVAEAHSNSRLWSGDPVLHTRASTSQCQNVQDERRRSLWPSLGKIIGHSQGQPWLGLRCKSILPSAHPTPSPLLSAGITLRSSPEQLF